MAERTGKDEAAQRLSARMRLLTQAMSALRITRTAAGKVTVAGVRGVMPMLELYSGVRVASLEKEDADTQEDGTPETSFLGLRPGEAAVLRAAGTKAVLETMEITSVTHPVYEGAPRYVAFSENNVRQTPHLVHFLALAAAARSWFGGGDEDCQGAAGPDDPDLQVDPQRTVAYVAMAPGEYAVVRNPLQPREIRRFAMRRRSQGRTQLAMLASSSDPTSIVAASTARQSTAMGGGMQAIRGVHRAPATMHAHHGGCGCGCGGGGHHAIPCGCGCTRAVRSFPPARYDDDGSCASLFDVSCETQWRIRECFKQALCDMLRCVRDEMCRDGELVDDPDLGRCVDGFVCSLLDCLPEAICPPPEKESCCGVLGHRNDCHCNFAVGE